MGRTLLGVAAIAACLVTTPAVAGGPDGFGGRDGVFVGGNGFGFSFGDGRRNDRRDRHDRRGDDEIGIWVNSGEWAQYNNRTFESDSFNGWWHDRPDRAYPAWVRNNQNMQNCRLYWAGGGWRC
jgi:hypothetical protein